MSSRTRWLRARRGGTEDPSSETLTRHPWVGSVLAVLLALTWHVSTSSRELQFNYVKR